MVLDIPLRKNVLGQKSISFLCWTPPPAVHFLSHSADHLEDHAALAKTFPLQREVWKSGHKIDVSNRVTHKDVTLRVSISKIFIEILLSSF